MKFLRGIVEWFASLESGESFQKWIQDVLKTIGVAAFIFSLVSSVVLVINVIAEVDSMGSLLFHLSVTILITLFTIVAGSVLIIMLIWNKCNKINALQNEDDFTLLNIAVILIRLSGEVAFIVIVCTSVHRLIAGTFGIAVPGMVNIFFFPVDIGVFFDWTVGVVSIIGIINGMAILISAYIIAALLNLIVGMAKDLRNVNATLSSEQPTSDS